MAEPLGVAASIAGLVSLATQLTMGCYACYSYLKSAKQATDQVKQVIDELNDFRASLQDIEKVYSYQAKPLTSAKNIVQKLKDCTTEIETFCDSLRLDFKGVRGTIEQLKWPKKQGAVNAFINKLQRYREFFESAKSNDTLLLVENAVVLGEKSLALGSELSELANIAQQKAKWTEVVEWLYPLDLNELQKLQDELYNQRRCKGSSTWILRNKEFNMWRHSMPHSYCSTLWCKGDPGSGKTIISSVIVNFLSNKDIPFAYFYCNNQSAQQQRPEHILGCLLKQLISSWPFQYSLPRELELLYESGKKRKLALSFGKLQTAFFDICGHFPRVHLVLDGLDELAQPSLSAIVSFLEQCSAARTIKTIFVSRSHLYQIGKAFRGVSVEIKPPDVDIRAMIKGRLRGNDHLQMVVDGDTTWEGRLASEILHRCAGQFLLAHMHLEHISSESSKADILDKLKRLTNVLPTEYDRNLDRIKQSPARSKLAYRVFSWLLAAQRPLHIEELREALAIGLQDDRLQESRKPTKPTILDSCLGLVRINGSSQTVEFYHLTVKEHIQSLKTIYSRSYVDIPRTCLNYLKFKDFSEVCTDDRTIEGRKEKYAFCSYVSEFWADHVRGTSEEGVKTMIIDFLTSKNILSALQLLPTEARNARLVGRQVDYAFCAQPTQELAVYLCACFMLNSTLGMLLEQSISPNTRAPWGEQYTSLHVAVCFGDVEMLKLLLDAGGDPNIQDCWGLTPLHLASRLKSSTEYDLIQALLSKASNLDISDQDGDTVLHIAVSYAKLEAVELLLLAGANPNRKNKDGLTPLHRALNRGHVRIVETLLRYGANPTITDNFNVSGIASALNSNDPVFVELVLNSIDCNGSPYNFSALDKTAAEGLLQKYTDCIEQHRKKKLEREQREAETENYRRTLRCNATVTELAWAAEKGAIRRLRELVNSGADVNRRDPVTGKTALHLAVENKRDKAALFLIRVGADETVEDAAGKMPIDYATDAEYYSIRALHPWNSSEASAAQRCGATRPLNDKGSSIGHEAHRDNKYPGNDDMKDEFSAATSSGSL